ncbi:MAG: hypothetical protein IT332_05505 [Ardenticatenales bacterium]|nr:hypothetical protein [Ardenticatenales bacterium]
MHRRFVSGLAVAAAAATLGGLIFGAPAAPDARAQGTAPERIDTGKACYVQLPDMPAERYGGFGGYNPETGVLVYAGGATKFGANETRVFADMYALKLDGVKDAWQKVTYSAGVGYASEKSDQGCREMSSVSLNGSNWLSVMGKDGCDNGNTDTSKKGGDIKELAIGDSASSSGVRWIPNSGVSSLPAGTELLKNEGKLTRLMAAYDTQRSRLIFGQGSYNDEIPTESQDVVYSAKKSGSKWNVQQLNIGGSKPVRRMGTCAAYVYDKDTGVDGAIVLGGNSGGQTSTTYNEVWWIDFKSGTNGVWQEITDRFANQKTADAEGLSFGGRREGACAYDPETKMFYSWFGRASSSIKDGASHSAGLWRANLSQLGDAAASLTWERLGADNIESTSAKKVRAVRAIPSVWDPKHKRFFVLGGRASGSDGNEAVDQAWVLYPDVTGEACATLDPYAPFRPGTLPTTSPPTATTPTGGTPATPRPTNTPGVFPTADTSVSACPQVESKAPAAALAQALSNPASLSGYNAPCNPNVPQSPVNPIRRHVTLRNVNLPYHPLYNGFVLRCGCQ